LAFFFCPLGGESGAEGRHEPKRASHPFLTNSHMRTYLPPSDAFQAEDLGLKGVMKLSEDMKKEQFKRSQKLFELRTKERELISEISGGACTTGGKEGKCVAEMA
jgi:hypothetical protein